MSVTSDVGAVFGRRGTPAAPGSFAGSEPRPGDAHDGDASHGAETSAERPILLLRKEAQRGLRHAARDFATLPVDALEARWTPRKAMIFVIVASAGLWVLIGLMVYGALQLLHR